MTTLSREQTSKLSAAFWALNLGIFALLFTVLLFVRAYLHNSFWKALAVTAFQETVAVALAWVLYNAYRHLTSSRDSALAVATWVIALTLAATLLHSTLAMAFAAWTQWSIPGWTYLEESLLRGILYWLIFTTWSLCVFWTRAERRAEQLHAEVERTELQLLRERLDPHFLFNALNILAAEIELRPASAVETVRSLADYLRFSLDHRHDTTIPLSAEMDAMRAYLRVQQARFGSRLEVSMDIPDSAAATPVPRFLLLPLVENAVKHCFGSAPPPWQLSILARIVGTRLELEVRNPGLLAATSAPGTGTGLETLRRRLELAYPRRHQFTLKQEGSVVCARVDLDGLPCSA